MVWGKVCRLGCGMKLAWCGVKFVGVTLGENCVVWDEGVKFITVVIINLG